MKKAIKWIPIIGKILKEGIKNYLKNQQLTLKPCMFDIYFDFIPI